MLVKQNSPFYRNPTLWLIVLLPSITVIVGIVFVIFSVIYYDGVVDDDYYKKGKQINQTIERDELASQLGLSAVVLLDSEKNLLNLRLQTQHQFDFPERLKLKFIHRTVSNQDVKLQLVQTSANNYLSVLPQLPQGLWQIELSAANWRLRKKISYPQENEFELSAKLINQ